jgi:hypothetical protein
VSLREDADAKAAAAMKPGVDVPTMLRLQIEALRLEVRAAVDALVAALGGP